jgi:tRNA-splicing ligase RtcB
MLAHWTRDIFEKSLHLSPGDLNMKLLYDVCHNIAKKEVHSVGGEKKKVCVHRKGATRAFPAGHPDVPEIYRGVGQPVLIPGDMGRYSYVLAGTEKAMEETFGSTCHGAGRLMSRTKAKKICRGRSIVKEMEDRGVIVMAEGRATLAEEIPEAYKDVSDVVEVVHQAGISRKVARLRPLGVVKG